MQEYEINTDTLALISEKGKTKVYENNQEFYVDKLANNIMEDSCAYFGSSLLGRQKGTSNLIGVTHKCPVIVEETKEIIFFPTCSPRLKECSWVSLKNIDRYYTVGNKVIIIFKNKQKIELSTSYGIIDNQVLRATRLESVLRGRKNRKNI
ncbi:MAG: competence protein ComK [Bacilli bacterium]|nr:competence protein ComK [Bacilli bacterium]